MHIILNNFKKKEKCLCNFVDLIIDYNLASYYSEITNKIIFLNITRAHSINKHTWIKVIGNIMADSVIFIS